MKNSVTNCVSFLLVTAIVTTCALVVGAARLGDLADRAAMDVQGSQQVRWAERGQAVAALAGSDRSRAAWLRDEVQQCVEERFYPRAVEAIRTRSLVPRPLDVSQSHALAAALEKECLIHSVEDVAFDDPEAGYFLASVGRTMGIEMAAL